MSDFMQKLMAAGLALLTGLGLALFGALVAHRLVWSAAGLFFATVGASAMLLTYAPAAPGPVGRFLRSPGVGVLILAAVLATLVFTLVVAVTGAEVIWMTG